MWREISRYGRKLAERGLVESHFGNISIRTGDRMLITRSGRSLDEISLGDVAEVGIYETSGYDASASSETIVHRAIYGDTPALAIIHAHPAFSVVISLICDNLVPADIEGQYLLKEIPVVEGSPGTDELAKNTASALKHHRGAIVRGHGTFAAGKDLGEAYEITAQIERSSMIRFHTGLYERVHGS
ncbi:MAG TPA: aldolase [Candidatus Methanoperedenaceae archaeon]|nr:aldolase [Candidatus Methanoperedenaceae archaeon]